MRLGKIGLNGQGLMVTGNGGIQVPKVEERIAKIVMGLDKIGLNGGGACIAFDRLVELPLPAQKNAQIVMSGSVLRIDGNGPSEGLYGCVDFALSGKLFALEAVVGGLAPLGFLRLPIAFSPVHPKPFPHVWEIGRDHND